MNAMNAAGERSENFIRINGLFNRAPKLADGPEESKQVCRTAGIPFDLFQGRPGRNGTVKRTGIRVFPTNEPAERAGFRMTGVHRIVLNCGELAEPLWL